MPGVFPGIALGTAVPAKARFSEPAARALATSPTSTRNTRIARDDMKEPPHQRRPPVPPVDGYPRIVQTVVNQGRSRQVWAEWPDLVIRYPGRLVLTPSRDYPVGACRRRCAPATAAPRSKAR